jgi:hypothetical protein
LPASLFPPRSHNTTVRPESANHFFALDCWFDRGSQDASPGWRPLRSVSTHNTTWSWLRGRSCLQSSEVGCRDGPKLSRATQSWLQGCSQAIQGRLRGRSCLRLVVGFRAARGRLRGQSSLLGHPGSTAGTEVSKVGCGVPSHSGLAAGTELPSATQGWLREQSWLGPPSVGCGDGVV